MDENIAIGGLDKLDKCVCVCGGGGGGGVGGGLEIQLFLLFDEVPGILRHLVKTDIFWKLKTSLQR